MVSASNSPSPSQVFSFFPRLLSPPPDVANPRGNGDPGEDGVLKKTNFLRAGMCGCAYVQAPE